MSDQQTPTVLWKWAKTHRASVNLRRFRSEEHTSELQSQSNIVCRLLLEKKQEDKQVTGKVYGSIPYEQSGIPERETSLILLTLDVHSNVQNPVTSAGLSFYNEADRLHSSAVRFTCWGEFHLSDLPGGADLNVFDFGKKGLVVSDPA